MIRPLFDAYLMVDWSANAAPKRGADSIWYCLLQRRGNGLRRRHLANPATRWRAREEITDILKDLTAAGQRVLAGFDFPNGYPAGFARAAGFSGAPRRAVSRPAWRAVWDGLDALIQDDAENANNRFAVAASLNQRISGGPFPFWDCPTQRQSAALSARKTRAYDATMPERRRCEAWLPRSQPCWKLYTTGSVGSQSLVGIPVLKALREHPELAPKTLVWPFETGLAPPDPGQSWQVILAEVYPSILKIEKKTWARTGVVKDAVQVETIARYLARRDDEGELAGDLAGPDSLSQADRALIRDEEGWILGAGTFA
ncbi:MAG: cobalamin biosynthesis protein CbiG [Alphaproteobacteria bacterium]|jgi:precorrin-8X/cobalt-precorrin-8 methylmutase|nr:cobalamin biosynthesis protein CbiG [Alphaproteobacteria bacterium]